MAALRRHSARATQSASSPGLSRSGERLAALSKGDSGEMPRRAPVAPRAFRLRNGMRTLADYGPPAGFPPLREAIAEYVAAARGTTCCAEQVIVTSGAQQGLALIARLVLDAGDAVWTEDPGYPRARASFAAAGARVVPVPVDIDGLDVAEGVRRAPRARMAYVTPSHQYPTGAVMSAARRLMLLRWAADANAWIVEDDYDSAYRYTSRPLASLHGLATDQRVIYMGTFSKTLYPALRIGYLIVPLELVSAFAAMRGIADRHSPNVDQAVLSEFISHGHYARHLRRMRILYTERRDALLDAGATFLPGLLELEAGDAGLHLVGRLPRGIDDRVASARALEHGVETPALSRYAIEPLERGGLLLGYAAFPPRDLRRAVRALARALDG